MIVSVVERRCRFQLERRNDFDAFAASNEFVVLGLASPTLLRIPSE